MTVEKVHHQAKLRLAVVEFPGQGFAVVDGGHFGDLPAELKRERLFARSLFLDHVDAEIQKAGPWLVALHQSPEAKDQIFAVVGDKPAAVFWCCNAGETVLYRHLRSINMARVPAWAMAGQDGSTSTSDSSSRAVFFRHFDPRVLGALLPVLDAAQFSRVLGPAAEIAFFASDFGGVRRVLLDKTFPPAPPGMLTIRSEQIEALNGRRLAASHYRIAACLKELQPDLLAATTEEELLAHIAMSDRSGRELGIESESAHGKWAYLMLMSHGRIARSPDARGFIARGDRSPDTQVSQLLDSTVEALKDWRVKIHRQRGGGHAGTV